jgi:hypothetical protein
MTDLPFSELLEAIRSTRNAYHKLMVIAGDAACGKTRLLNQISKELDLPGINLSLLLSERLLGQTRRQRALKAEEVAIGVIDEHLKAGLCVDNTELLFDSALHLDPLKFLRDVSRNRLIVASWNGSLSDGQLRFARSGHPDYYSESARGIPVVTVADENLQLYLTT